ncbi:MAG TPA: AmmeMemoRadiSam system protein A [Bacteroidota bacterium]|nr:AmmeMemoRadiSam system protein A [Bacteroidota bacterium]
MLSPAEKRELLDIAWKSVRRTVQGNAHGPIKAPRQSINTESMLWQPAGAFVSLYRHGELRGCLGLIVSEAPLAETVSQLAGRTATEDPRFPAVTPGELDGLRIEISILSPLKEISAIEEIQVGKHGLFIVAGMYRGLLLPQVAVKHRWNVTRFLEETCIKAGLPPDQWKHAETAIYTFTAEIIEQETK